MASVRVTSPVPDKPSWKPGEYKSDSSSPPRPQKRDIRRRKNVVSPDQTSPDAERPLSAESDGVRTSAIYLHDNVVNMYVIAPDEEDAEGHIERIETTTKDKSIVLERGEPEVRARTPNLSRASMRLSELARSSSSLDTSFTSHTSPPVSPHPGMIQNAEAAQVELRKSESSPPKSEVTTDERTTSKTTSSSVKSSTASSVPSIASGKPPSGSGKPPLPRPPKPTPRRSKVYSDSSSSAPSSPSKSPPKQRTVSSTEKTTFSQSKSPEDTDDSDYNAEFSDNSDDLDSYNERYRPIPGSLQNIASRERVTLTKTRTVTKSHSDIAFEPPSFVTSIPKPKVMTRSQTDLRNEQKPSMIICDIDISDGARTLPKPKEFKPNVRLLGLPRPYSSRRDSYGRIDFSLLKSQADEQVKKNPETYSMGYRTSSYGSYPSLHRFRFSSSNSLLSSRPEMKSYGDISLDDSKSDNRNSQVVAPLSTQEDDSVFDNNTQDDTHTSTKNDTHTNAKNDTHTNVNNDTHTNVNNDTHTNVNNDAHTNVKNDTPNGSAIMVKETSTVKSADQGSDKENAGDLINSEINKDEDLPLKDVNNQVEKVKKKKSKSISGSQDNLLSSQTNDTDKPKKKKKLRSKGDEDSVSIQGENEEKKVKKRKSKTKDRSGSSATEDAGSVGLPEAPGKETKKKRTKSKDRSSSDATEDGLLRSSDADGLEAKPKRRSKKKERSIDNLADVITPNVDVTNDGQITVDGNVQMPAIKTDITSPSLEQKQDSLTSQEPPRPDGLQISKEGGALRGSLTKKKKRKSSDKGSKEDLLRAEIGIPSGQISVTEPQGNLQRYDKSSDLNFGGMEAGDVAVPTVKNIEMTLPDIDIDAPEVPKKMFGLDKDIGFNQEAKGIEVPELPLKSGGVSVDTVKADVKGGIEAVSSNLKGRLPSGADVKGAGHQIGLDVDMPHIDGASKGEITMPSLDSKHDFSNITRKGDIPDFEVNLKGPSLPEKQLPATHNIEVQRPDIELKQNAGEMLRDVKGSLDAASASLPTDLTIDAGLPGLSVEGIKKKKKSTGEKKKKKKKKESASDGASDGISVDLSVPQISGQTKLTTDLPSAKGGFVGPGGVQIVRIDSNNGVQELEENLRAGIDVGDIQADLKTDIELGAPTLQAEIPDIGDVKGSLKKKKKKGTSTLKKKKKDKELDVDVPAISQDVSVNLPQADVKLERPDLNADLQTALDTVGDVKTDLKGSVNVPDISASVQAPEIDGMKMADYQVQAPVVEVPKANFKDKFRLSFKKKKGKGGDVDLPEVDPSVNVNVQEKDLELPDVDIEKPELNVEGSKFNLKDKFNLSFKRKSKEVDVNVPHVDPSIGVEVPDKDVKLPDAPEGSFSLEGVKADFQAALDTAGNKIRHTFKRKSKEIDVNVPAIDPDVDVNLPEKDFELHADRPEGSISLDGVKTDFQAGLQADVKGPEVEVPDVKVPKGKSKMKLSFRKKKKDGGLPSKDIDVNIPKADINLPSGDIDLNAEGPSIPKIHADVNAPKVNIPEVDLPEISPPDLSADAKGFSFKGKLPKFSFGKKDKDIDINLPSRDIDLKAEGPDIPKIEADVDAELRGPSFQAPEVEGKGFSLKGKMPKFSLGKKDVPSLDVDVNTPQVDIPEVDVPEVSPPDLSADTKGFSLKGKLPKYSFGRKSKEFDVPSVDPKLSLDGKGDLDFDVNAPDIDLKGPEIDTPEVDAKGFSLKGKFPKFSLGKKDIPGVDVDVNAPQVEVPEVDVPEVSPPDLSADTKGFSLKGKLPKYSFSRKSKEFDIPSVDPNLSLDGKGDLDFDVNAPDIDLKGPEIDSPEVDAKGFSLKGKFPKFSLGKKDIPGVDVDANAPQVEVPEIDVPEVSPPDLSADTKGFSLKGKLPKYSFGRKSKEFDVPSVDPNLSLDGKGDLDVNINAPNVDLKGPEIDMPEVDAKGFSLKGKLPKFSLGKKDVPGIDMDVNAPKVDIPEVDLPEVSAPDLSADVKGFSVEAPDLEVPDVKIPKGKGKMKLSFRKKKKGLSGKLPEPDINIPSGDVNLNAEGPSIPEVHGGIDIPEVEGKGFSLKGKLPKFSLGKKDVPGIDLDVNTPEVEVPDVSAPDLNVNAPDIDLKGPEIDMPEVDSKGFSLKGKLPKFSLGKKDVPDIDLDVNAPRVDIPEVDLPEVSPPDLSADTKGFSFKGKLPKYSFGRKSKEFDVPSVDPNLSLDGKGEFDVDINAPNVDMKGPEINMPEVDTKGFSLKGKLQKFSLGKKDVPGLDADINVPEVDIPEVSAPDLDVNAPDIDLKGPKIDMPEVDAKGFSLKGKLPKFSLGKKDVPGIDLDVNVPKVDIPEVDLPEVSAPDLSADVKGFSLEAPDVEVPDVKIPKGKGKMKLSFRKKKKGLSGKLPEPDINIPSGDVDLNAEGPSIPEVHGGIDIPEVEGKGFSLKGKLPNFSLGKKNVPGIDLDMNAPKVEVPEVSAPDFDVNAPNIDLKGPEIDMPEVDSKGFSLKGKLPKFSLGKKDVPSLDVDVSAPQVDIPEVDLPEVSPPDLSADTKGFSLKGKLPKYSFGRKSKEFDVPSVDPNLSLDGKRDLDVDINAPNVDLKGPEIDMPEVDTKGFSLKGKFPKFSLGKKDAPGFNVDVNAPQIEVPEVDVPEVSPPDLSADTKGFSLKGKLPKYSFGRKSKEFDVPSVDPNLSLDGKGDFDVDVNVPNIDLKGPEIDVPEVDSKGFSFKGKLPKFSLGKKDVPGIDVDANAPKVDIPEVDVPEIRPPDLSADVKGFSVNAPDLEVPDVKIPKGKGKMKLSFRKKKKDLSGKLQSKDIDVNIPEPDINLPSGDINLPSGDVNLKAQGPNIPKMQADFKAPKVDVPEVDLPEISPPDLSTDAKGFSLKGKLPKFSFGKKDKDIDVNLPSGDVYLNAQRPDLDANLSMPEMKDVSLEGPSILAPEVDGKGFSLKGKLPHFSLGKKGKDVDIPTVDPNLDVEINAGQMQIPEFDVPEVSPPDLSADTKGFSLKGKLPKYSFGRKGKEFDVPSVDPNLSLGRKGDLDVEMNAPKLSIPEVDVPEVSPPDLSADVKGFSVKGKLPKYSYARKSKEFDLPEADLNQNLRLEGKEMDVSLTRPDVDVRGVHLSKDINLPGFKAPSGSIGIGRRSMEFATPEVDIPGVDAEIKPLPIPVAYSEAPNANVKVDYTMPEANIKGGYALPSSNAPEVSGQYPGSDLRAQASGIVDQTSHEVNTAISAIKPKIKKSKKKKKREIKVETDMPYSKTSQMAVSDTSLNKFEMKAVLSEVLRTVSITSDSQHSTEYFSCDSLPVDDIPLDTVSVRTEDEYLDCRSEQSYPLVEKGNYLKKAEGSGSSKVPSGEYGVNFGSAEVSLDSGEVPQRKKKKKTKSKDGEEGTKKKSKKKSKVIIPGTDVEVELPNVKDIAKEDECDMSGEVDPWSDNSRSNSLRRSFRSKEKMRERLRRRELEGAVDAKLESSTISDPNFGSPSLSGQRMDVMFIEEIESPERRRVEVERIVRTEPPEVGAYSYQMERSPPLPLRSPVAVPPLPSKDPVALDVTYSPKSETETLIPSDISVVGSSISEPVVAISPAKKSKYPPRTVSMPQDKRHSGETSPEVYGTANKPVMRKSALKKGPSTERVRSGHDTSADTLDSNGDNPKKKVAIALPHQATPEIKARPSSLFSFEGGPPSPNRTADDDIDSPLMADVITAQESVDLDGPLQGVGKEPIQLSYIDFFPGRTDQKQKFASFDNLVDRANIWLEKRPNFVVFRCETLEFKNRSDEDGRMDNYTTSYKESAGRDMKYIKALRLWIRDRISDDLSGPDFLGYFNILPHPLEMHDGTIKYSTLPQAIDYMNTCLRADPMPGKLLNVEHLEMKLPDMEDELDPDCTFWVEDDRTNTIVYFARIYFKHGEKIREDLECVDFVPKINQGSKSLSKCSIESYSGVVKQARDWLNTRKKQYGRLVSVQSVNYRATQSWGTKNPDTYQMVCQQGRKTTHLIQCLRLTLTKVANETDVMPGVLKPFVRLYHRTFRPVLLTRPGVFSKITFETFSQTMNRALAWINAARCQVFGIETSRMRVKGGMRTLKPDNTNTALTTEDELVLHFIRIYLDGPFVEPPPEDLPPIPEPAKHAEACCSLS